MVEDHILSTTHGLVNRSYMDELWETSVSKIVAVLRTNSVSLFFVFTVYGYFIHVNFIMVDHFLELRHFY